MRFVGALCPTNAFSLLIGALFFYASLTPSLMPRGAVVQGALAGILAVVGYGVGQLLQWLRAYFEIPEIPPPWRVKLGRASLVLCVVIVLASTWKAADWQNSTRAAVDLPPVSTSHPLNILIVAIVVFVPLWFAALSFQLLLRSVHQQLERVVPRRISTVVSFVIACWVFWAIGEGVLLRNLFQFADSGLEAADRFIDPEIPMPTDPMRTGSESSEVQWKDLGRWGRDYVNRAPTRTEISEFVGDGALDPVRVYVGLRAAPTPRERAELALKEFIRVGGFDRSAIVVMVPVGTGWMDPFGMDTMEFILGGDVATVAVQYSYLKAALSVMADTEVGNEQAGLLFKMFYAHWSQLPKESRPKFYVHGLSQGAQISQNTLPILDFLDNPIDGVLWVGSPFFSPVWSHVRDGRNPESPIWQPRYGNGSMIRVANQRSGLEQFDAPWGPVRLLFLNYASDPIVMFSYDMAYRCPEWLKEPRGFDVSPDFRWFPVVSMLQVGLDTTISLEAPGHGHYYRAEDYIDAWAEVLGPADWNAERSAQLKEIFSRRGPAF